MGKPRIIILPTPMLRKQVGQMNKLFGLWENSNKRKDDTYTRINPPVVKDGTPAFLSQTKGLNTKYVTRRQIVLNRHFTEIISDVLALNLKKQLHDMDVTVTSIETKAWNKGVSVFYTTSRPFNDQLHTELKQLVHQLRIALTERRLIGRTPHVNFVFDRSKMLEKSLDESLERAKLHSEEETRLVSQMATQLHITKNLGSPGTKLISKRYEAPSDMKNTLAGLDYPKLFDEVALKLERGRAETSRMIPNNSLFPAAIPIFRAPREDEDLEDPYTRITRMQKFIVSQKQKSEKLARIRRKKELLSRDSYKWTTADESDDDADGPITAEDNLKDVD